MKTDPQELELADEALMGRMQALLAAESEAFAALKSAFPKGRKVRWKHGEYMQTGTVRELLGFSYRSARFRIQNTATGREVLIDVYRVITETVGHHD